MFLLFEPSLIQKKVLQDLQGVRNALKTKTKLGDFKINKQKTKKPELSNSEIKLYLYIYLLYLYQI